MDQFNNTPNNNVVDLSSGKMSETLAPEHKGGAGAVVGAIVIVLVIVLGALYFWGKDINMKNKEDAATQEVAQEEAAILNGADQVAEALKQQGASDTASSIEADLKATNLDSLDEGVLNVESQF